MARFCVTPRTKIIYLANPNNPTGTANTEADLLAFVRGLPDHVVAVVDEAYADFAEETALPLARERENVIVLRTFSKSFSLAGMRIGLGFAHLRIIDGLNATLAFYAWPGQRGTRAGAGESTAGVATRRRH